MIALFADRGISVFSWPFRKVGFLRSDNIKMSGVRKFFSSDQEAKGSEAVKKK